MTCFFVSLIMLGVGLGVGYYVGGHPVETDTRLAEFGDWVKSKLMGKKP